MWSDPLTNMAYGNQWMNPAHYKNMTNEQGTLLILYLKIICITV